MVARLLRMFGPIAGAALLAGAVSAEARHGGAITRLRHCGGETCLLISGHRADRATPILIAHHDVAVTGGRHWRAEVPLHTVEHWLAPSARSITIEVAGGEEVQALLPIGLFSQSTELAFLDLSAGR